MSAVFLVVDLEILLTLIVGTSLFLLLGALLIFFVLSYKRKYREHNLEKKALHLQFQKTILQTQLEIQEQTFKNISLEIHDNIGQCLSLAKLNLNTMPYTEDPLMMNKILTSKELVSKAIGDLRDLSHTLNTDYVQEMGFHRAVEYEVEMVKKTGVLEVEVITIGKIIQFSKQKELVLIRIVQETLNNIIKHAEASNISMTFRYEQNALELSIEDNGKGVDLDLIGSASGEGFGLGIRSMHDRARLIGADFKISSSLNIGTRVEINLASEIENDYKNQS